MSRTPDDPRLGPDRVPDREIHPVPDDAAAPAPPHDEEALLRFADSLSDVLRRDAARSELPPELSAKLVRATRNYRPDESRAWAFLGAFLVVVAGVVGAAVWTPMILLGLVAVAALGTAADRVARALGDRGLAARIREAVDRR